ncbi:MAG: RecQ family ATP-dependent DNA helicase [Bacteroidota bacterium]
MTSPEEILKKYWNFDSFRKPQKEIIETVLKKQNVVALLPTGGGKSLCFQIPTLINEGVCIVISPLIALMNDQVENLKKKGINAIAVTSKLSFNDTITAFDNLRFGNYKFLYLSPEKLQSELIQEKIKQLSVNLIAIDEAHCISEWGHDFRPSYLKIDTLQKIQPEANIIALTASATPVVLQDIVKNLDLINPSVFKRSFSRNNINYRIKFTEDILGNLFDILQKNNEPAIVYTGTRKASVNISNYLNKNNIKSSYYHGGLTFDEKEEAFESWISEKRPVMVATNAFGMGIDKANVRTVIHLNLPYSIENYLQETGRAGRDGKESYAFLLFNNTTIFDFKNMFKKGMATVDICKNVYMNLNKYYQISPGEIFEKNYLFNLQEFCSAYKLPVLSTYNALTTLGLENIIEFDQNINKKSVVKITIDNDSLFAYLDRNPNLDKFVKLLLRNYGGIFEQFTPINEYFLAKRFQKRKVEVVSILNQLDNDKILIYKSYKNTSELKFLVPREDNFVINRISENINKRNNLKINKVKEVVRFVENDSICRSVQLLQYFGETDKIKPCNNCDVCLKNNKVTVDYQVIANNILDLFNKNDELNSKEIVSQLSFDEKNILKTLQFLLEKNTLGLTSQNKFTKL